MNNKYSDKVREELEDAHQRLERYMRELDYAKAGKEQATKDIEMLTNVLEALEKVQL